MPGEIVIRHRTIRRGSFNWALNIFVINSNYVNKLKYIALYFRRFILSRISSPRYKIHYILVKCQSNFKINSVELPIYSNSTEPKTSGQLLIPYACFFLFFFFSL